ncbi:uracil-DNA glycosylase [Coriobacteriaceae bacterium]|uniref:Type-4 uracil-DNA glycosylase n=1 Tax=Granulimonas faecalis TaxID=2894155 RepID=A0AAV5AXK8_9ACTN|nr:uracil-DNA glycosylase [Granulimonas faecalis]MBF0599748.1 uracil-DNA glycosylase [Atopobiaceae bacterium FL090493]TGY58060.1 uracil-DNA glycosylase [Coriobacteriaceae bacterium]GJM54591.1 uracil-DNA glycosylase [Granulimonas faecalis]
MAMLKIPGYENQRPGEVPLSAVRDLLGDCRRCPLCETRTNIVFGDGDAYARVVIVGEAPGKNEDLSGVPFVGAAGKKLDALLEIAGLRRDEVYICNVLKCRPPSNRDPRPEEIAECSPFLREQIRSVWPDVIVCLGNFATRFILRTEQGITSLRGRFYETGHFHVLPVFHPAAAIYDRTKQASLEADFALLGQWLAEHPAAPAPAAGGVPVGEE